MQLPFLMRPIVLFIVAVFLLRLTGRRSIAQMTIAQTVMIISIGAIIVEPFADKDIKKTIIAATIYIILLIIFEVIEFHCHFFKKLVVGEPVIIIENGKFNGKNLKKLRLTEEEAKSRVRQAGIPKLEYIQEGTIEPNGEFGFRLTKQAEPLRVEDLQYIFNYLLQEDIKTRAYVDLAQLLEQHNLKR